MEGCNSSKKILKQDPETSNEESNKRHGTKSQITRKDEARNSTTSQNAHQPKGEDEKLKDESDRTIFIVITHRYQVTRYLPGRLSVLSQSPSRCTDRTFDHSYGYPSSGDSFRHPWDTVQFHVPKTGSCEKGEIHASDCPTDEKVPAEVP
ncbi:hypothetical protein RUM44_006502 [Polyplax serrata]|uniref:Uncharacterized protein n=1 Tax=Polyplax serrata TaxID=468196 RepID=A0ABR1AI98_POLSC